MSAINSSVFPIGLPADGLPAFPQGAGGTGGTGFAGAPAPSDLRSSGWSPPPSAAGFGAAPYGEGAADGSYDNGAPSFSSVLTGLINALSRLVGQLGALTGNLNAAPGSGANPAGGASQSGVASQAGATPFADATLASVGDPHDSLNGTTAAGTAVHATWNDMRGHGNLLDSDSFSGGYRVSTSVTEPSAQGITHNASATVTTAGGATSVTMNEDGSYAVVADGRNVTLEQGHAVDLGNGQRVTLTASNQLTVDQQNGRGGSLETKLVASGGGVDVTATAHDVDLAGYLIDKSDARIDFPTTVGYAGYVADAPASIVSRPWLHSSDVDPNALA